MRSQAYDGASNKSERQTELQLPQHPLHPLHFSLFELGSYGFIQGGECP